MLTPTQAAQKYNVSERTVDRWATRDGAPHERHGKAILFDEDALDGFLAEHYWLLPLPTETRKLRAFSDRLVSKIASDRRYIATLEATNKMLATANRRLAGAKQ